MSIPTPHAGQAFSKEHGQGRRRKLPGFYLKKRHPDLMQTALPAIFNIAYRVLFLRSVYFFCFDEVDPLGHTATHPIEPLATRLGALLLLAGSSCASSLRLPRRAASGPLGRFQLRMKSCRLTGSRWTVPWPSRRAIRAAGQICSYGVFVIPAQAGIQTAPDSGLRVIDGKSTTWRKNKFALIRAAPALQCSPSWV